jgi:hypothetical protein
VAATTVPFDPNDRLEQSTRNHTEPHSASLGHRFLADLWRNRQILWCATRFRLTEWRCKDSTAGLSQQAGEAGGSLTLEAQGRVGAAPTTTGRVGTARRPGSGKQDEQVYARNQC